MGRLPGVIEATVNLATEQAKVRYLPAMLTPDAIAAAVRGAGYEPRLEAEAAPGTPDDSLGRDLRLGLAFTLPLLILAMGPMLWMPLGHWLDARLGWRGQGLLQMLLAAPVLFWAGRRFLRHGWAELRSLSPGMSSLVMLGGGAAFGYSTLVLLAPGSFPPGTAHFYFEATAVIVTLILLGKMAGGPRQGADLGGHPPPGRVATPHGAGDPRGAGAGSPPGGGQPRRSRHRPPRRAGGDGRRGGERRELGR